VLSILQQRGSDDSVMGRRVPAAAAAPAGGAGGSDVFAKISLGGGGGPAARLPAGPAHAGAEGGLAAALRRTAPAADAGAAGPAGSAPGAASSAAAAHAMVVGSMRDAHMRAAVGVAQPIAEESGGDDSDDSEAEGPTGRGRVAATGPARRAAADDSDSDEEEGGVALGASGIRRAPGGSRAHRLPSDTRDEGIFESDI
jgi:hypothetical protein